MIAPESIITRLIRNVVTSNIGFDSYFCYQTNVLCGSVAQSDNCARKYYYGGNITGSRLHRSLFLFYEFIL